MTDYDPNSPDLPEGDLAEPATGRGRRLGGSILSGLISMVIHAALMIALGLLTLPSKSESGSLPLVAGTLDRPEELLTQELDDVLDPALGLPGAEVAGGLEPEGTPAEELSIGPMEIEATDVTVALNDTALPGPEMDLLSELGPGLEGTTRAVVTDSHQAVDRLTDELTRMLLTRNVLLIWCFDQSNSIKPDRDDIRQRVRKIYAELAQSPFAQGDAMLTAVTSFGQGFMVHTARPTYDFDEIEAAIDAVEEDPSGVELLCQAVNRAIETHRRYSSERLQTEAADVPSPPAGQDRPFAFTRKEIVISQRQMALILVTDESGDRNENLAYLEKTIDTAKRARCRIYVMGREASFGYPHARVRWTDPEFNTTWTIDVDRGPETADFEVLQFDGFGRRSDLLLSGFGPYDLVRMAKETGGTYYLLPNKGLSKEEVGRRERQMEQMRQYVPETDSRNRYTGARSVSPLRQTVWEVISDFDAWNEDWLKRITLPMGFPADARRFGSLVTTGTTAARNLVRDYDRAISSLETVGKFRQDEPRLRWQANYDLLLAQLIAYRARMSEYLACLEPAAGGSPPSAEPPKEEMRLVSWTVRTSKELCDPDKNQADVDRAIKLLGDVVKNHADTPWAVRAEWELKRPLGYHLEAVWRPIPKPAKVAAKPKTTPPKPPTPPKPAKPKPKPVKPNL